MRGRFCDGASAETVIVERERVFDRNKIFQSVQSVFSPVVVLVQKIVMLS
jgi:hypothetical protein